MAVHNFVDVLLHPRCLQLNKCLSAFRHFSQMAVFHPYCHSSFRLCLGDGCCVGTIMDIMGIIMDIRGSSWTSGNHHGHQGIISKPSWTSWNHHGTIMDIMEHQETIMDIMEPSGISWDHHWIIMEPSRNHRESSCDHHGSSGASWTIRGSSGNHHGIIGSH